MLRRVSLGLLASAISIASLFAIAFRTDAIAEGDALVHMGGIGQQRNPLGWGIWIRSPAETVRRSRRDEGMTYTPSKLETLFLILNNADKLIGPGYGMGNNIAVMLRTFLLASALTLAGVMPMQAGHHHGGGHHGGGHHGGGHHGGGWHHNNWGWYQNRRAAWGIAGLATGAIISSAIANSRAQNSPTIVVPETNRRLNYDLDQSSPQLGNVDFTYTINGTKVNAQADCQQGLINGNQPASAADVHTLNAVCHTASN